MLKKTAEVAHKQVVNTVIEQQQCSGLELSLRVLAASLEVSSGCSGTVQRH